MNIIIADDEPLLRLHLKEKLALLWPQATLIAEASDGVQATKAITDLCPDVAFLDIRMPGLDGLEVARITAGRCHIVFVTAYEQHAVQAFEQHAVDYLLKPYSDARLEQTIARLKAINSPPAENAAIHAVIAQLSHLQPSIAAPLRWLRVASGQETRLVNVEDVVYFEADEKYTSVYTTTAEYLIRTPLKELETQLNAETFWRVHRSVIVNAAFIESATRTLDGRYHVGLRGRSNILTVSRAYAALFKQM